MTFQERILFLRNERKLSQEALANMMGVTRQTISRWETGASYPELVKLPLLCRILYTTPALLCAPDHIPMPPTPSVPYIVPDINPLFLGESIRAFRQNQGMSQEVLGDTLSVTRQTVSRWESGGMIPDTDKFLALLSLFNTDANTLLYANHPSQAAPPIPPRPTAQPKPKKTALVITVIAVALVVLASFVGGFLLVSSLFSDPATTTPPPHTVNPFDTPTDSQPGSDDPAHTTDRQPGWDNPDEYLDASTFYTSDKAILVDFAAEDKLILLSLPADKDNIPLSDFIHLSYGFQYTTAGTLFKNNALTVAEGETAEGNITVTYGGSKMVYTIRATRALLYDITFEALSGVTLVEPGAYCPKPTEEPQKDGYFFDGWNFDFDSTPIESDRQITAIWRPVLTLVANGGKVANTTLIIRPDTTLPTPTRGSHRFEGWYCDMDLTKAVTDETLKKPGTLYARWSGEDAPADYTYRLSGDKKSYVISGVKAAACQKEENRIPSYIAGLPVTYVCGVTQSAPVVILPTTFRAFQEIPYVECGFQNNQNIKELRFSESNFAGSIPENCFQDCIKLQKIELPVGATTIESYAFSGCSDLKAIDLSHVTTIGTAAFASCSSLKTIDLSSVKTISDYCFSNALSLESVTLPSSYQLTSMGHGAFSGCEALRAIDLSCINLTDIRDRAFENCTSLQTVTVHQRKSNYVTTVTSRDCFIGCTSLTEIIFHEDMESIPAYAFRNCPGLLSLTLPERITSVGEMAFYGCSSLKTVILPDGFTGLGKNCFGKCTRLESVRLPEGISIIAEGVFADCSSLKTINLPDSLRYLRQKAFQNCASLESLVIPDGITQIEDYTFENCRSLNKVTLPAKLESIGYCAFKNCKALQAITFPYTLEYLYFNCFSGCESLQKVTVPPGDPALMKQKARYAFEDCTSLTEIVFLEGWTTIPYSFLAGCTSLETVTLPATVTDIEGYAFQNCTSLPRITLPEKLLTLQKGAFQGCQSLKSIDLPDTLTEIGQAAFGGCTALISISCPESITTLGQGAFSGCTSLVKVTLPEAITELSNDLFAGCTALEKISLPNGIKTILSGCFQNCTNLSEVTLNEGLEKIQSAVFSGCTALKTLSIPASVTYIAYSGSGATDAFSGCENLTVTWNGAEHLWYQVYKGEIPVFFTKPTLQ